MTKNAKENINKFDILCLSQLEMKLVRDKHLQRVSVVSKVIYIRVFPKWISLNSVNHDKIQK